MRKAACDLACAHRRRLAERTVLDERGIAVRAGLHCAPLAHESAGTLATGTVRLSFGHSCSRQESREFLRRMGGIFPEEVVKKL